MDCDERFFLWILCSDGRLEHVWESADWDLQSYAISPVKLLWAKLNCKCVRVWIVLSSLLSLKHLLLFSGAIAILSVIFLLCVNYIKWGKAFTEVPMVIRKKVCPYKLKGSSRHCLSWFTHDHWCGIALLWLNALIFLVWKEHLTNLTTPDIFVCESNGDEIQVGKRFYPPLQ